MPKVLVADKLPKDTVDLLEKAGLDVDNSPGLSPDELKEAIKNVHGIIVRSGAKVTADVLDAAEELQAVCRAGVGVDNIDVEAATRKGVAVMNTPAGNTISTAEHTFALILALSRNVGPAYISMRDGKWDRKKFMGGELAGTTLGIIGLGRVGRALAVRAQAFGMKIIAHDPFLSREMAGKLGVELAENMEQVLKGCDYLTVHVPGGEQTRGLIGEGEIALMKEGARIINCARGEVVDLEAAVKAVKEGRLAGAAFDVYADEPPADFSFAQDDRILATPHLGASTEAAQLAVGVEAAEQMIDALTRGHYRNALNMIAVSPEEMEVLRPYCSVACRVGKVAGVLNRGRPVSLQITCKGELAERNTAPIVSYGAMGVLQSALGEPVNIVSAPQLAEERGLHVTSSLEMGLAAGFTDLVVVRLVTDAGECEVAGTVFGRDQERIVRIGPFNIELIPEGHLLLVFSQDKPGLIGQVGEALGKAGINIARMTFSRQAPGGEALIALNLDSPAGEDSLKAICEWDIVDKAVQLSL